MLTLAGRGVLIVGTRRMGADVARCLAKQGVHVAIVYRHSAKEAANLCRELAKTGVRTKAICADLVDEKSVVQAVKEAKTALGDLSFVVNLASDYVATSLGDLDAQAFDDAMSMAKGSYLLALHAAKLFNKNPGPTRGHIILFGDWAAGETPYRGYLPYLAAKSTIHFLTRGLAVELAQYGILVNCIAPGPTIRPAEISESEWQHCVIKATPLKRESSSQEIAELTVMLCKSETITGEIIRVDAGRHIQGNAVDS